LVPRSEQAILDDEPSLVLTIATWEALKRGSGRATDLEHLDRHYEGNAP